ncbi:MAG: nitrate- and nitrite sensing domain-containing protein [Micromonosporaceae bacterium]
MIKRVKTAQAVPPRRGLLPRLRNVRIRSKLGLILIIPIVALIGFAVVRFAEGVQSMVQAQEAGKYAEVSRQAAELGEHLQIERSMAASFLTSSTDDRQKSESAYEDQFEETDKRATAYTDARDSLRSVAPNIKQILDRVDAQLEELAGLREAVTDRDKITMSSAIFRYRIVIADLLAYRESLANTAGDAEAADLARGGAALAAYTEYSAQEQVVGTLLLSEPELTPSQQESFIATLAGQDESLRAFSNAVEERHVAELQRIVAGKGVGKGPGELKLEGRLEDKSNAQIQASVQAAHRFESDIRRTVPGSEVTLSGDAGAAEWADAMAIRVALTRAVEEQVDEEYQANIKRQESELVRRLIAEGLTVLLVLFIAALITLLIARSMARSLRRLREGALAVAYESLPQSVARLRNPDTLGELTPDQVAASVKDPVQVRGRDEIGQVSQAFNVVHREAVRIAAEQAALRANVATMFINLARRSQALVDRLIGHLDRLERGEEDPDRLAELFQLDHLATRMRRNDENLLVLAGADSTRVQRDPAPLSDVLRAAQSEVEQYTRVEFGIVDRDVEVAPHAVNDVVHLLAELFDNATSFSPPDTVVVVDARRAGDRAILQIEDRGIGISAEQLAELNTRLASPPLVDVAVSRMMGLVVVGRLATRHGIRVELRAARDRGTIADVILPAAALILPQRGGRQHTMGLPHARSPLALEGGQGASRQRDGWHAERPERAPRPGAGDWDPTPNWGRPGPGSMPPAPANPPAASFSDGYDAGGARSHGPSGGRGGQDPNLPRRRPGEGLTPTGQPTPITPRGQVPSDAPMDDVLSRRPAAEPRVGPDPRGHFDAPPPQGRTPSRESIHSTELPMGHGSPQANQRPGNPPMGSATFGITGVSSGGFPLVTPPTSTGTSRPAPHPNGTPAATPRPGRPAGSAPGPSGAKSSTSDPSPVPSNVDDTMELPIFREVESAWFRTKEPSRPTAREASGGTGGAGMPDSGGKGQRPPDARPTPSPRQGAAMNSGNGTRGAAPVAKGAPQEQAPWQTAADDGWRAASAAADSVGIGTTNAGLPKRVPMAQLVPGGVDTGATGARNRSPDAVRGLLSAYHRGVQRGRQSSVRTSSDESPGKEQA